jgi:outer membrane murein-binding lipoprotein Lpp
MALTNAERQKRYQERKRERLQRAPDITRPYLKEPFFEFMPETSWEEFELPLGLVGIKIERFTDDTGARDTAEKFDEWGAGEGKYDRYTGSVGRAELMIDCLLDSALILAGCVNQYKKQELDRAIDQLGNDVAASPKDRKRAVAELVRLSNMRDRLDKSVRWEVPQYELKEED